MPLDEGREVYLLRVSADGVLLHEMELATPAFVHAAGMRAADGTPGPLLMQVAQISDTLGPGPSAEIAVPG